MSDTVDIVTVKMAWRIYPATVLLFTSLLFYLKKIGLSGKGHGTSRSGMYKGDGGCMQIEPVGSMAIERVAKDGARQS